jgi:(1->4)-alpha-D-glucan 1-alpha-D-glucosylmutase
MLTGLARTALKCTLPGLPDLYQGTEFWDFSYVDPDNRSPVDYAARAAGLEGDAAVSDLLAEWRDGRVKQRLLARLLADRAEAPSLYAEGDYRPLAAEGGRARHLAAFLRSSGEDSLLVVVPRLTAALVEGEQPPVGSGCWRDTTLAVPGGRWRDVVTGRELETLPGPHLVGELLAGCPVAVLRTRP